MKATTFSSSYTTPASACRATMTQNMHSRAAGVVFCAMRAIFHFHLHVIPRYAGDGWTLKAESLERERSLLDSDAQAIRDAIASTD